MTKIPFPALCVALVACSTLAEPAGGDSNMPSAGVGPFRKLDATEVRGTAPLVLDDTTAAYRSPSALALDPGTTEVALYFVMHDAATDHDVIARTRATDGRLFYGATLDIGHHPAKVLGADATWESADLSHPCVLAVGGEVWLYYTSNGAVGRARSPDGFAFAKDAAPVLTPDALGPIASASVAELPGGGFVMMLAQGDSIYEAKSADGATFQRVDADPGTPAMDPVLGPAPPAGTLAPGVLPPFDTLRVADPCVAPRTTPAGRLQIRVLYTGYAAGEAGVASAIGFAARYGDSGPLARAAGAVYAIGANESAPSLFEWKDGSFLYVEQDSKDGTYRALGGAVAPATIELAPEDPYPDSP
jgi:hypothetical protein